jgi:hypothetical protein
VTTARKIIEAYPNAEPVAKNIVSLSKKLGIPDAGWLANLINFETGGRFSPSITNHIGATGLIQFIPDTAKGLGTSTAELRQMTHQEQWVYVEEYFMRKKRRGATFNNPTDVYMAVYFPAAMGKGGDFSIYDYYVKHRGKAYADKYLRDNNGIKTAQDYTDFANRNAKLPTGKGVLIPHTSVRILPILAGVSVTLLGLALYIRIAQPEWAEFINRRRG